MPKLDPDVAPLSKEIKAHHARFKKAVAKKSVEHIKACLAASFASRAYSSTYYTGNQNECANLSWQCEVIEPYRNILLHTSVALAFNEQEVVSNVVFNDNWIYAAQFPLPLTQSIHEAWAKKLAHIVQLLAEPEGFTPAIFDWWNEEQMVEHLGWLLSDEEKESNALDPDAVCEIHTDRLQRVMESLDKEPEQATLHWPTLAPWLQTMRALMPPPAPLDTGDVDGAQWAVWSRTLRALHVKPTPEALALPAAFDEEPSPKS